MAKIDLSTKPVLNNIPGTDTPGRGLATVPANNDIDSDGGKILKILHLEDLPSDALLVAKALKKGGLVYVGKVVESKVDFIKALKEFAPDVILADHALPSFNSTEALAVFQETGMKIPFILITSAMSDEFAVNIIKKGADDYILKDRLNRLVTAIQNSLEKFRHEKELKNYLEELEKKEKRFRALVENSMEAVVIFNAEGMITYVSPSVEQILGYTGDEIKNIVLPAISHPEDLTALATVMEQVLANPGVPVKGHTGRMLHKNGSWRWLEATVTNLLHDPAINGIVDNFRDITDRKLAENKITHANRLYAFISQINQSIMHSRDEQTVFKAACRIAIDYGKFSAAWIGIFDADQQKISLVEASGIPEKDIVRFKNVQLKDSGPQYHVLKSDGYYLCNDIQNDLELNDWKIFANENDIGSVIVLPIRKSGSIIGTFNFYAREVAFFTSAEIALVEEATKDISFALDVFEKEALRIQAVEKLADSELSLKQAQAISHLGSWEMNFATGIATWSEEQLSIYGLRSEDKEQSLNSWLSLVHPDDVAYVAKVTNEVKSGLSNADFFYRIIRKDGTERYLYAQTRFKLNNAGILTGLQGVVQDITETKKSEQALRESESNLQAIFENTSEGFILTDTTGIIKSFNNQSKEIIQLNTEQEISVGDSIYDFIHPSRKNNYKNALASVLSGNTLRYDYSYTRKNGDVKWFDFKINPVYVSGEIAGLSITSTDITDRKQAEELLRRSESNLNAIIENTDAFIYSLDKDFSYVTFNKALQKMMKDHYGLTISPGYNVFDFINEFDPAGVQEWKDIYTKAFSGEIIKFEKEFIAGDFRNYTSFSIHPIWENENVIGLSCFVHDITQEKEAETETRFKANLLNTIGQAAIATDINGEVIYWNRAAELIYGWTNEEVTGKNINVLIPPHQTEVQAVQIQEELNKGHSWSGEFTVQRKDGSAFPAFVTDSPIYDHNHKLSGIIRISSDITEKKNLEDLLEKTNQLARIGSWEVDLVKNTLFWSSITKMIHGVADDFVPDIETGISFYKEGYSREAVTTAINEAMKNGTAFDLELQILTPKGDECWVRVNGETAFESGNCLRVYGSFQDIDKSKKAEIELLKVYEEKNIILESIGDAFFAVDKKWVVTYWNNHAEKMLQVGKSAVVGKNLWDVFSASIDSASFINYQQAVETRQLICFNDYYPSLDKWFEINAYPSGNGLSVFFKDITQQRKLKNEREKMTVDIIQRNKALEQFSYIISHNLRAPVANIIGLAFTLQKENLDDGLKKVIMKALSSSVNKLDEVIKDLNDILTARQEMKMRKESVSFTKLANDIWASIEYMTVSQNAVILVDFSEVDQIVTIKSYLHSIFYNLISNSLKYRQPGIAPKIEIRSHKEMDNVILLFKDNGLGIDLHKKGDEVFGLYKRFHTQLAEGKGLGLYMVKTQVESIGGSITISSEVGKGTEFRIEFKN